MFTFTKFILKTIFTIVVFVVLAGYLLAPKHGENMFAPNTPEKIENKVNTAGGLIIPKHDPRFNY